MDFTPQKLPKELYDELVKAGVHCLILKWEGGSDNAELDIEFQMGTHLKTATGDSEQFSAEKVVNKFDDKVRRWAHDSHYYSGAGDGNYYGDDVTYDLINKQVTHSEWYNTTVREDGDSSSYGFDEMDEAEDDV